jgi:putative ABC transport system substrate-binding protein
MIDIVRGAAQSLDISVRPVLAATPADLESAFQEIARLKADVLLVLADPIRPVIVSLAEAKRIPAIYQFSEFAEVGGLISYGPSVATMFRRSAYYVDRILKGTNPAELPVEQPTAFELVLNLKTAKAIGLSFSESIIARADRVIE